MKPSGVVWCGVTDTLFTTGFSKMRDREYALWDVRSLGKALFMEKLDTSQGLLSPLYDADTNMVYLAGKVTVSYLRVMLA